MQIYKLYERSQWFGVYSVESVLPFPGLHDVCHTESAAEHTFCLLLSSADLINGRLCAIFTRLGGAEESVHSRTYICSERSAEMHTEVENNP